MSVSTTAPEVPAVPDVCFGDAATANGMTDVPEAAPSLFPSGSPAGGSPRFDQGLDTRGQGPQAGDANFLDNTIADATGPALYGPIVDRGTFYG